MKCIEHWYMQLYFQLKIQITKSAYTDYWWAASGAYVSEGPPDLIQHTTIFIISFFSFVVGSESVMAFPSPTVTRRARLGRVAPLGRPWSVYKSDVECLFVSLNGQMTLKVKVNASHFQYQLR